MAKIVKTQGRTTGFGQSLRPSRGQRLSAASGAPSLCPQLFRRQRCRQPV